ncbi:acyltransferase [Gorillibacterium timonense]|uniref:acyltransferase n=1 Tax=Gorillibacterium timonense TaxID=1689269 RepID=UPI0009EBF5B2|nr:acyltransferase [Gorillibacterium timonense]
MNGTKARLNRWLSSEPPFEEYLRLGMQVGEHCRIQPGVVFDYSHCWLIEIGNEVTIAPQAYLLAHDASTKAWSGYTRIGRVVIEDGAFIGARAVIMPGVTVGHHSIIAAGSIVTKSVPPNSVFGGNPAKEICTMAAYREKCESEMREMPLYDSSYTLSGGITDREKREMQEALMQGRGFVV